MKQAAIILLLLIFKSFHCFSQRDSTIYTSDMFLQDGIYLTHQDFMHYRGIQREQIVTKIDENQLEFIGKVVFEGKFTYKERDGKETTVESKDVWGYMQNNTLFVNYKGDFYRVPVFGSISYLVANVTVINPGFYDPRFGMGSATTGTTKEIREFLMNFYDGYIREFTLDAAEQLLQRDPAIFAEFKKLSRRKQKEQIYGFIRRYNTQHPIYFQRR